MANTGFADKTRAERHQRAVAVLHSALQSETAFKKVHAAEALIWCGYPQGVEAAFQDELKTEPESIIGVWRTMAQLPAPDEGNRTLYLHKIYALLPDAKDLALLRTLETLAKLHYQERPLAIQRIAEQKIGRPAAFARWILANSGAAHDEANLAGLLAAPDDATRGTAAYAIRWLPSIRPSTLQRLHACLDLEKSPTPWRTLVWSALYIHAPKRDVEDAKARLLSLTSSGTNGDKYEIGQALALRGDESDVPLLEKLMADPEIDVRISAAYALIQIDRRFAIQREAQNCALVGTHP